MSLKVVRYLLDTFTINGNDYELKIPVFNVCPGISAPKSESRLYISVGPYTEEGDSVNNPNYTWNYKMNSSHYYTQETFAFMAMAMLPTFQSLCDIGNIPTSISTITSKSGKMTMYYRLETFQGAQYLQCRFSTSANLDGSKANLLATEKLFKYDNGVLTYSPYKGNDYSSRINFTCYATPTFRSDTDKETAISRGIDEAKRYFTCCNMTYYGAQEVYLQFTSGSQETYPQSTITATEFTSGTATLESFDYTEVKSWPGPSSGTGGTGGDFDNSTDSVAIPSLPTVAPAVSSNFITIYHPTMSELEQIGTVLWSSTISAAIKNLFSDPINAIISLHQTPFPLSTAAQKTEWFVGLVGTGVSMNKVTQQYLQYDFGSVDITEYWGNALDYSPYTKAQIYLPYIGIKDLDIDDIMASSVRVVYHVDILTGTCVAYIIVTKKDERSPLYDTPTVMYQFTGNTNLMIPYTGADYSALVQNIITLAGAAVAAGATGGLSTQVTGADAIMGASTAMQSVGAVSGSKPTLLRGGQTGGVAGALGVQNCAIYLTRPNQSLAEDYASERGYPSNITATLGDLTGFTAVESCHVGISGATDEELAEIESFLKSGVIL